MKNNRRKFLKLTGLAGLSMTSMGIISACTSQKDSSERSGIAPEGKNLQTNQEWLKVKYGGWGGPGVSAGSGPMDGVLLKDYAPRSSVVVPETFVPKSKYAAIDVHVHNYPAGAQSKTPEAALADWVKTMDEVGIEMSVLLTGATGERFDKLVEMYLEPYPDRFQLYCGLERTDIGKPDYPDRAVAELVRCYEKGARGVGEVSDKGLGFTRDSSLTRNERLHPNDSRLDPFWKKCAELNLPVNLHIADHPSAWEPPDIFQERSPIFQQFSRYGEKGLSYEELLIVRNRTLKKHPDTTFICCHLSNQGNDLEALSYALDKYPNLYLDISARDYEIGRTPQAVSNFLAKHSNRILFGTDMGTQKSMYQSWWRLLESADEYMVGRVWWPYYGLELPASVLESLYRGNAQRIMNWEGHQGLRN